MRKFCKTKGKSTYKLILYCFIYATYKRTIINTEDMGKGGRSLFITFTYHLSGREHALKHSTSIFFSNICPCVSLVNQPSLSVSNVSLNACPMANCLSTFYTPESTF